MRIRILLLALIVHQGWAQLSYQYGSTSEAEPTQQHSSDNPERDGESSKRIIGSSVVTSVSVILNGNEPEFTDALGMKVPKPQVPHLQVASPINLLNPDRYEFYTFDDNGELVKRLMTMQEIQSIVANGDGEGPTIIHSAPLDDRDPEKNVQDIVKSVQSVLNREVESNKNSSDKQPILDTPDVSSSWSMILPAIFGNTGGDIFPQNKPQQVVMTPDSDVVEATTKATGNKRKPSSKPKPQKKKNGNRRKTTTKRISSTTPLTEQDATEVPESTTRKIFINNQEVVQALETDQLQHVENLAKKPPGVHGKPSSTHTGTKRPQSTKQKNKTKRPTTTTVATTTTETATEPTTITTEPSTTTTTTTTTTPAPTTTAEPTTTAAPATTTSAPAEATVVKEKPPQKKRKKPTRKPSTSAPILEVTTERHISHHHKRKQTTPRPSIHNKPAHKPTYEDTTPQIHNKPLHKPIHEGHKVPSTTTPQPTTTTTTTTPQPTTTTTTTAPEPTTTTTTTTPEPTTTTATTPEPTTTTTPEPTTTTTTTTPVPFTFATYRPSPPTTTSTTTTQPSTTSTTGSYYQTTTTKRPSYAPNIFQQQLFQDYGISYDSFAPSVKKEKIPMPGKLTEKEEDINTKLSFDQILQSLKQESATEHELEASASEEINVPARLPPVTYPSGGSLEAINETPSPIRDLPNTMASTNFQNYDEVDELTSRPITQLKPLDSYESLESLSADEKKKDEVEDEEGPLVIITSRPQQFISNKATPAAGKPLSEASTSFYEPEATTTRPEDHEVDATTRKQVPIKGEESAHVVKFEPLYADVQEPVVTTFTTTESPVTTMSGDYSNEDDLTTTMAPMDSIMQKIDAIISQSLKANGAPNISSGYTQQSIPHISTMTMKDFKTQAATVASILEDSNTVQSSESTVMNSSETKDEIEFLLSDVINQMTQTQQPTMATTAVPSIVALKPQANSNQEETNAHRLSNFAQINPALQISAAATAAAVAGLKEGSVGQPTIDESIQTIPVGSQPLDAKDEVADDVVATTGIPDVEKDSDYAMISQGNDELEEETNVPAEEESDTVQKVFHTTQRAYVSSEELSKEVMSSEEKVERTTIKPQPVGDDSTEEDGSEQMIVVTSAPAVVEEEKSTEIPGETAVVLSDSDMEESNEMPEFTTIVPALQTGSHLLEGEDPYVKLGEIGAKPTVQSLAQMIYGQSTKEEKSEEAETGKIDENQTVHESDILQKIDASAESQVVTTSEEKEPAVKLPEETTIVPQMIQVIQPAKKPMMNMAQMALEQALMYATKVPLDFEDDVVTTVEPIQEEATTIEVKVVETTTPTPAPTTVKQTTTTTRAPSSTVPTKKPHNTLKPVSYFNKQPSLINEQKFTAFQAAQQRPVVRPASLSNLKMPPSSATRAPVKLDPSPAGYLGLEESTIGLEDDVQQFSQLCNELAFTYWRSITSEKISSARSLVLSPFALTSMLSMVFLGARGSTSGEMNEVLKLDDMVTFNPHLVFKNITDSVEKATDSEISSSAFVREAFSDRANGKILQFFKEKTQQFYSGHVEEVNFHVVNDIIRRRTNLLVKRHTMGKVMEYLRTNSVWVNGPLATISANLYQTDCSRASVNDRDGEMFFQVHPSIRQRRLVPIPAVLYRSGFTAGYEPNLDATVVAFGRSFETVSTIYVMPGQQGPIAPADSLDLLEKKLIETSFTKHAWKDILTTLMERPGLEVQLPRFSHRSFVNASMGLQKMGLKGLFKADLADLRGLTGLAAKDIYLSDMIQINTFSTCAEEKIGEHHHVEMYPAPPIRKRNKDVRENEDPEADSSESVIDFGSIVQDTGRAFYDDLLDPKFLELPLPLRPRQARIPDAPRLRFDRPFLYFVRHNPTGMILFMGRFNPRLLP